MQQVRIRWRGTSVTSGQENKGKVCTRRENVPGIRSASETNFEVNVGLANTDLLQTHGALIEVMIILDTVLRTICSRFNFDLIL